MKKYIKGKKTIIELGSGNGCIKKIIDGKKIILTDITKYPWIDKKVDMMKMNLGKKYLKKVDVFIINHSLHHCANPALTLENMSIYLKKNGNEFETNSISLGKSHWNNNQDLNGDYIFRLMSMSKPITALAAMQLVEKGKLNLDSPVEEVLPEIKEIPVLNADSKLVKQSKSITLRHLMSHTSGFAYNSLMMITSKKIKDLSISMKILLFLKGIITYIYPFSKGPRLFEAGTDFKYGTGLGFVGMMIEKVTGQSLEEYCKENIFNPLDMKNTFFTIPREKRDKIVPLGIRQGKKSKVIRKMPFKGQPYLRFWRKSYYGGTEIFSSPNDYANFVKCLMNKGSYNNKQIISESSFNEMIKPGKFDQMFERDDNYNFIMGENGRLKNKMNRKEL